MKTGVENLLESQLNGLQLPPSNTLSNWEMGLIIFLILLVILTVILVLRYKINHQKPAVVATRKLKALQDSNLTDQQSTAIAITQILRRGLNVNRLDDYLPNQPNPTEQNTTWETFKTQLNKACYAANDSNEININQLFNESHMWLSKAINEQTNFDSSLDSSFDSNSV